MFFILYAAAAAYQIWAGYHSGGWSTPLGELHFLFGGYIALDALKELS